MTKDRHGFVPSWEEWDGEGFPGSSFDATVYFALGEADIEDPATLKALAKKLREDGVVPTVYAGMGLLEDATVVHGQVRKADGELFPWFGVTEWDDDVNEITLDATWVEIGEYLGE
ncbi:hypothetical protein QEH42_gp106 [Microbacterium phage Pumpernickel]|uniref:Uncharacterized protein n=1 Tax=Microbacterium phage Pumpernickel TaxID=2885983 RepID=A0AAE8Y9Y1_9CAUD|nr:hypothetical protein QEH42_gp106 [Microbacterium phage Pumpernickel]UDL15897.1 hypothetical protein SEA_PUMPERNICKEL_106 [Microbacterium phage Pumpernickel]